MPFLDTSDVLCDPDFCDMTLVCDRTAVSATTGGVGVASVVPTPFVGTVTSDKGGSINRTAEGEHASEFILIVTRFELLDAKRGYTADVVHWNKKRYTVVKVNEYTTYGVGFVEATCELIPLSGGG